jgi:hypothetical protein
MLLRDHCWDTNAADATVNLDLISKAKLKKKT